MKKNKVEITVDRKKRVIMKFDDCVVIISANEDFKGLRKVTKGLKTYLLNKDSIEDFWRYNKLEDKVYYTVKMTYEIECLFDMIANNVIYGDPNRWSF